MNGLEGQLARGGALMVAMKLSVKVLGFVSTMVVARILTPADYGVVAIAMGIVGILEILGEFSFDLALIRNQGATRDHYNTAWTLNLIRGVVFAIGIYLSADQIALWVGRDEIADLLRLLALVPLADGLTNIGTVDFRKHFKFERELILHVASKMIEVAAAITAAYTLRNYWALCLGIVVGRLSNVCIGYIMSPYRPRICLTKWRDIAEFIGWMFGYNVLCSLSWKLDIIIIGRLLPASSTGSYANADSIASLPTTQMVMPISRALFPGFSAIATDHGRLKEIYVKSLGTTIGIVLPLTFCLSVMASSVVMVLLGPQWSEAATILAVIAPAYGFAMLYAGSESVLIARGKTRELFLRGLARLVIRPLAFYLLVSSYGLMGAIWAFWVAVTADVLFMQILIKRTLGFGYAELVREIYRPTIAAAGMWFVLYALVSDHPSSGIDALEKLALSIPLGGLIYFSLLFVVWALHRRPPGFEQNLLFLAGSIKRRLSL